MPAIDSENVDKYKVFDAISVQFPRAFVIRSYTVETKERKLCSILFEEQAAKTLQNDSELVEKLKKFSIFTFLCDLYVLFESFWCQNVGKRSTMI